jgi:hypothetical protein
MEKQSNKQFKRGSAPEQNRKFTWLVALLYISSALTASFLCISKNCNSEYGVNLNDKKIASDLAVLL